jgi:hypothetical protein
MKIYRFTDLTGHSRAGTAGAHAAYRAGQGTPRRNAEGGSDIVDISPEARSRFERSRIMQLEEARLKKLAADYSPLVRRKVELEDDLPSRIHRHLVIYEIRDLVRRGLYDFDSEAAMRDAAENVLAQLLGR